MSWPAQPAGSQAKNEQLACKAQESKRFSHQTNECQYYGG